MATRQIKMPVKDNSEQEVVDEVFSQRKRPERGRYLLQVDRQTKGSYTTSETAQAAALVIKKNFRLCGCRFTTASITRTRWSRRRPPNHDEVPRLPSVTLEPLALSPRDADAYLSIGEPSLY